jgi:uncharacterized protein YkwD
VELPVGVAALPTTGVVPDSEGVQVVVAVERSTQMHNQARKDRDHRALCVHPTLQKAARAHSKDMIERDYFSHDTKGRNEDACERIRRYGYAWRV